MKKSAKLSALPSRSATSASAAASLTEEISGEVARAAGRQGCVGCSRVGQLLDELEEHAFHHRGARGEIENWPLTPPRTSHIDHAADVASPAVASVVEALRQIGRFAVSRRASATSSRSSRHIQPSSGGQVQPGDRPSFRSALATWRQRAFSTGVDVYSSSPAR